MDKKNVKAYMQSIGISDIYYGKHIFNVAEKNNEQEINIVQLV